MIRLPAACRVLCTGGGVASRRNIVRWSSVVPLRYQSTGGRSSPKDLEIEGRKYLTDSWFNAPDSIISSIPRRLHLQPGHPLSVTRQLIETRFPGYQYHNNLFPIVTTQQNFDSLAFPKDHPGRSRTDTYYINKDTLLRTHTSAHQADTFRANTSEGFLISADVYRRDAVDRSHYPIFHQMEGARTWSRSATPSGTTIAEVIKQDLANTPSHDIKVEDPNPAFHPERNPLQTEAGHTPEEAEAMAAHLKRTLEDVFVTIFTHARAAALAADPANTAAQEPLKMRWVEAYFPFTSPSWELEVFWQGDWLEVLGCGVVNQVILNKAGVDDRIGWAFGLGLERIAMLLYEIPDIRLYWSRDERFLSQFSEPRVKEGKKVFNIKRFTPFSKYPACYKDVAFWLPDTAASTKESLPTPLSKTGEDASSTPNPAGGLLTGTQPSLHENDVHSLIRDVAGELAEDVKLVDSFKHPKTGRQSQCYRINYRSLERTLTNEEANAVHEDVRTALKERLGVTLR